MKKVLMCGMMLGLLTAVGFAQRGGRASMGGVGPTARISNPGVMPNISAHGGIAPNAGAAPNARTSIGSPNVAMPSTVGARPSATTVGPMTTLGTPNARTGVAPNAKTGTATTTDPNARLGSTNAQ